MPSTTTGAAVQVWANAAGARRQGARIVKRGKRYTMTVTDFKRKGSRVTTLLERSLSTAVFLQWTTAAK